MSRAGQYRQWISLHKPSEHTFADDGQEILSPYLQYWQGFASFTPDSGSESMQTDQVVATVSWTCKLRYVPEVSPTHRIHYEGRIYEIVSVIDPNQQRRSLEIRAVEVV